MTEATELEDRIARRVNYPPVSDEEWERVKRLHGHVYAEWIRDARKNIAAIKGHFETLPKRIPTMAELCDIDENAMKRAVGFGERALSFHEGDFRTAIVKSVWDAMALCLNNDLPSTPTPQEPSPTSSSSALIDTACISTPAK